MADHKHDHKAEPRAETKAEPKSEPKATLTPEEQMQLPHSINEPPGSEVIIPDGDGENTLLAQKAGVPLTAPPRKKQDEDERKPRK